MSSKVCSVLFLFASLLIGLSTTAQADSQITLSCDQTFKSAPGYKIKKRDLRIDSSCSFSFEIHVVSNGSVYFGNAVYNSPAGKKGKVFTGSQAELVAASRTFFYNSSSRQEITLPDFQVLGVSPVLDEITGGNLGLPSGLVCTVAARSVKRSELFPYNASVGGSDYNNKSYLLSEAVNWECRR